MSRSVPRCPSCRSELLEGAAVFPWGVAVCHPPSNARITAIIVVFTFFLLRISFHCHELISKRQMPRVACLMPHFCAPGKQFDLGRNLLEKSWQKCLRQVLFSRLGCAALAALREGLTCALPN